MRPLSSSSAIPGTAAAKPAAAAPLKGSGHEASDTKAKVAAVSADELFLKQKGIEVNKPLAPDSLWYKTKRFVANIICNIDLPFMRSHKLGDKAPADLLAKMQPGDILLRRTQWTSGNLMIPSYWKHAAVYTGKGNLVEATFKGVQKNDMNTFFDHGDEVLILRPKNLTEDQRKIMVAYSNMQNGRPYDFNMDFDDDRRLSCTELAAQSLRAAGLGNYVKEDFLGKIVGDYFKNDHFELIYTSNPKKSKLAPAS